jgi:hypothetical protein
VWGKYIDPALVGLQVRVLHLTRVLTAPSPYHGVIGSLVGVVVSGVVVSGVVVSGVVVSGVVVSGVVVSGVVVSVSSRGLT